MANVRASYSKINGEHVVTFQDENGNETQHVEGTRAWRNNNPGNTKGAAGAIGRDRNRDGFDIFPDLATGQAAKERLLKGKYGDYPSVRDVLKGKFDKDGNYIPGTGYAPKSDGNDPDGYADQIRKWTGLDVDKKKIKDMTPEEFGNLTEAMKRYEGWKPGSRYRKDSNGDRVPLEADEKPSQNSPRNPSAKGPDTANTAPGNPAPGKQPEASGNRGAGSLAPKSPASPDDDIRDATGDIDGGPGYIIRKIWKDKLRQPDRSSSDEKGFESLQVATNLPSGQLLYDPVKSREMLDDDRRKALENLKKPDDYEGLSYWSV